MDDKTKKWLLFGCGGCLVVVLVIAVVAMVAGGACISSCQQMGNESVEGIFGDEYKPPSNYMVLMGLPLGGTTPGEPKNMVVMMNAQGGTVLLAMDTDVTAEQMQGLQQADEQTMKGLVDAFSQSSGSSDTQIESVQDVQMVSVGGKQVPVVNAIVTKDGEYLPASIMLVPQTSNELVFLMSMDAQHKLASADADASAYQGMLQKELADLVTDSPLDEQIP